MAVKRLPELEILRFYAQVNIARERRLARESLARKKRMSHRHAAILSSQVSPQTISQEQTPIIEIIEEIAVA